MIDLEKFLDAKRTFLLKIEHAGDAEVGGLVRDYLKFLLEAYDSGIIGYITFPYLVAPLMQFDGKGISGDNLFGRIVEAAGVLELPDRNLISRDISRKELESGLVSDISEFSE